MKVTPNNSMPKTYNLSHKDFLNAFEEAQTFYIQYPKKHTEACTKFKQLIAIIEQSELPIENSKISDCYYYYLLTLYRSGDYITSLSYSDLVLSKVDPSNIKHIGNIYIIRSAVLLVKGSYNECIETANKAIEILTPLEKPKLISPAINNLASACYEIGQYEKALTQYYFLLKKHKTYDLGNAYGTIYYNFLNCLMSQKRYDLILKECQLIETELKQRKDYYGLTWIYFAYCNYYNKVYDSISLLKYVKLAEELINKYNYKRLVHYLYNYYSIVYIQNNEYTKALPYTILFYENAIEQESTNSELRSLVLLLDLYLKDQTLVCSNLHLPIFKKYEQDIFKIVARIETLILSIGLPYNKHYMCATLISFYKQNKQFNKVIYFLELENELLKKLYNIEKNDLIFRLQAEYERERLEQALSHQKELLKQQEDISNSLKVFAYSASHDMKEPLRMISSFGQLLKRKTAPSLTDQHEYINYIISASSRMHILLDDLLQYSLMGHNLPALKVVDLNEVLLIIKSNLQHAIQANRASINASPLPKIQAHQTLITQLFQNLISNAIKFKSPDRLPQIDISYEAKDQQHYLIISDNGIGIPLAKQQLIFETFSRLHSKSEYPGSGIGLASCKKVVEIYGGNIWVTSNPDTGSSFHIQLPCQQAS